MMFQKIDVEFKVERVSNELKETENKNGMCCENDEPIESFNTYYR